MVWFGVIVGVAVFLILTYDLYRAIKYGFSATLSYWVMVNSTKYPAIPALLGFVIGLLFGHLFWNQLLNVTICPGGFPSK